ncbi:MAG: 50S ribosomal protein L13 [Candidatus Hadarchaeota archaeon]
MLIIDGKDLILGRLATFTAKKLLEGERVTIINAAEVLISGRRDAILEEYRAWLETRTVTNPRKGPFHPKQPEDLVRKSVRGMLPWKTARGKDAFRRLRVHRGAPEDLAGKEKVALPDASLERLGTGRYLKLEKLSKLLGAKA